ncbi:hypothetical protein J4U02_gp095 [Mycobacterium phage Aziz]|uniref:Uncharacterized protein n=1 Tax=Mycobacterium phage Aziz TaxID=2762281 RepID=A0A7G8LHN3_9CAUD|nr:hypothetical protein J4U02_gp095 [Mycobacterium phage Aziz]ASR75943.1 hypothetical protein SEA_GENEVAB15_97 [Mycobacterium phage GenevaB15]QNJ56755.1 hypothetical protein SEA_AZIZ_95 [Mycobacterium phage Aziz]
MSYRYAKYILISDDRVDERVFRVLGAAKGIRTRYYKGKGDIYEVVAGESWEPRLELVDSQ